MESTKHFLKSQFERLTLKPGAPSLSEAIKAWTSVAAKLVDSFGEEKFALAVQKWLEQEQFFPNNPNVDLRKYLPAAKREMCVLCRDSEGWVEIRDERNGRTKMVSCKHPGCAA